MTELGSRTPPHDIEAEQALLGICMNTGRIPEAAQDLKGIDFYRPAHEQIWKALNTLVKSGKNCDAISVNAWLTEQQIITKVGGAPYLHDLIAVAPVALTADSVVEIITDRSLRRHIITAHTRGLQDAYESPDDAETLLQRAEEHLAKVPARDSGNFDTLQTLDDFLGEQISEPDWVMHGYLARRERLIITGGEGLGKTTWLRQMAVCTAAGMDPFSGVVTKPQTVLAIDVENPRHIMQKRYAELRQAVSAHGVIMDRSRFWMDSREQGLNLGDPADVRWLRRRVRAVNPDLLVIGPAYKLHDAGNDDKDETIARTVTGVLDQLRVEADCALILEHHAGNETGGAQRPIRPFGSSVWRRWPEFGFGIRYAKPPRGMDTTEVERRRLVDVVAWRGARDERGWPRHMESGGRDMPWIETVLEAA